MNRFPATASAPPNHDFKAAIDVLGMHRIDCCANGRCFTIPFAEIQNALRIAGSAVRPMLRSMPSRPIVHPEDMQSAWLEILGICNFQTGNEPMVALAFCASSPFVINHLIRNQNRRLHPTLKQKSEKIRLVNQAAELVIKFEGKFGIGDAARSSSVERALTNLNGAVMELGPNLLSKAKSPTANEINQQGACLFFVCQESIHDRMEELLSSAHVKILPVDSLTNFMSGPLNGWREILGTGWLPSIDRFVHQLKLATSFPKQHDYVQADLSAGARTGPEELAVTAAAKFASFGWLPQQHSSPAVILEKSVLGKFKKTTGGALNDGDLSVFRLPRIVFPGEEELRIRTPEERLKSSWLQFQTTFSQDDVFLYCDHGAYGEREIDVEEFEGPDPARRKLMPLGFIRPSALGVLRCLFPAMEIDIIGYAAAASTTTRSAVLERLLRLAAIQPSNPDVLSKLSNEVSSLRCPSLLRRPKCSPHTRCVELEGLIQGSQSDFPPSDVSCAGVFLDSWPKKLLKSLFESGRSRQRNVVDVFSTAVLLVSLLCRVDPDKLRPLILAGDNGASRELELVHLLCKLISSAAEGDPDVRRTKGNGFSHLALRKEMVIMIRDAVKGRLAVPPLLAEWITKHVRLTCVMPLDPLAPSDFSCPSPKGKRLLPCSFQSHKIYHELFSPEPVKSEIEVDLSPLLDLAIRALATGDDTKPSGWLANKISQTNELSAALMVRTGHLEDFPYGELLSQKTARNPRNMLLTLHSRIILRCILAEDAGRALLMRWCEDLIAKVSCKWGKDIRGTDPKSSTLSSRAQTLLEVFGDIEGISAAALDCCRRRLLATGCAQTVENQFVVYFLSDELVNRFRAPHLDQSYGVRSYEAFRYHEDKKAKESYGKW